MAKRASQPKLLQNARVVLEERYLRRAEDGRLIETPQGMFERVARSVAEAEPREKSKWADRFLEVMTDLRFLPNSPTLMNAGKGEGAQLAACFVLPVEDRLSGIFETLKNAAVIHQSGGGTGFSFSRLRPKGSAVGQNLGVASGPVSFIRIFDSATETIKQGGTRRGANMGILRVDHPDIEEFIEAKSDLCSIMNFNLSVGITDVFMEAVERHAGFELVDPRSGRSVRKVRADELFEQICRAAWKSGDPGLVFLDRIGRFNPTPAEGPIESTNPCGEQPLLPYESCNLGSLNLGRYHSSRGGFAWGVFREDVRLAVRFLDDVIEVNQYPLKECERITRRNRKIGLGVMGFADLLLKLGVPYDSPEGRLWGERVMSFLDREAKRMSAEIGAKKGAFPNWQRSMWNKLGYPKLRNATVSTVAPTGSISMIAGASSGIEPLYSGVFHRNVLSGKRLTEVHPSVREVLGIAEGVVPEEAEAEINRRMATRLGRAWRTAGDIPVADHILMQSVFQRYSDSAVSKTINLSEGATVEDVASAYRLAYLSGCKGITIYRDKSRPVQVLERPGPPVCRVC